MKKFLRKVLGFVSSLLLIFLFVFGLNRYFSDFGINSENTTLVIGHSHSECAYNDSLIFGVSNYSESGETYFYNYLKVKKLIIQNPHIDKILIEFTNNQIKRYIDNRIWEDKYISYRFPKYVSFMDKNDFKLLFAKNPMYFKSSFSVSFKSNFQMLAKRLNYTTEIGGYKYLERNFTDSTEEENVTTEEKINPNLISVYNIEYLDKMITFCKENNVKVFLIRSPLHKNYDGFDNEVMFQNLLNTKYKEFEFLDFAKFPLNNDEYGDFQHLNHKGARKYSLWFDVILKKGLFEKANKQHFINTEINSLNIEL